ncbi:hypothetical protein DFH08DRAFT_861207 [Mycena albidolilacea]|uniref:Uncharacterized protein n=1 Tax=Mycena albidolilacea TaxID=1033008 RepID=A0AAD7A615_9AGAR|nr:hypothetical protein DFH08DRAFT_861207 [Mycena albidolilacea]
MFINFRTFRKILLGTILLISATSVVLSVYLKPYLKPSPNSAYVLLGILDTLIFAIILSVGRTLFQSPQTVATEALGLFALLPFALILALYSMTLSVTPDQNVLSIFSILQILIFIGTTLHGLYTIGLLCTAMLTVCVFDADVYARDIDSSPSPFPMSFLLGSICPCFCRSDPASLDLEYVPEHPNIVCLPGCNCSIAKTQLPNTSEGERTPGLQPTANNMLMVRGLSSRSLVRVPNDVERRSSIAVSFEEV